MSLTIIDDICTIEMITMLNLLSPSINIQIHFIELEVLMHFALFSYRENRSKHISVEEF